MLTKSGVILELNNSVESFVHFIQNLPEQDLKAQTWGPKEILAHFVFWHEEYVLHLGATFKDRPYLLPQGHFDDLNALAVKKNARKSVSSLVKRFLRAQKRLNSLLVKATDADLNQKLQFKEGTSPRTVLIGMDRVEAHIREHLRKLQLIYGK